MRTCVLFLFFIMTFLSFAQNASRTIRAGVVPYQLFSRSSGLYIGVEKNHFSVEYRPTYTFSQEWSIIENFSSGADIAYHQGINNNFLIDLNTSTHFRFLLIQRTWWYNNKFLPVDNQPSAKNEVLRTNMSALIAGGGAGMELYWDLSKKVSDLRLYIDLSLSYLKGKRKVMNSSFSSYYGIPGSYNRTMLLGNFTIGFEIGSRKTKIFEEPTD